MTDLRQTIRAITEVICMPCPTHPKMSSKRVHNFLRDPADKETDQKHKRRVLWTGASIRMGQGGHVPPIFGLGGTLSRMSPSIFLE